MATKYSGSLSGGRYNLDVYIEVRDQDVANNRSLVRQTVSLYKTAPASFYDSATVTLAVSRHNQSLYGGNVAINTQNAQVVYLWSTDTWMQHAEDGTLSFPLVASITGVTGSPNVGTVSNVGGDMTVLTIPRGSKPTFQGAVTYVDAGTNLTVLTNRASSSFTHTLRWQLGSASGTIATGVGASHTWAVPLSILTNIPNRIDGQLVIALDTYDAGGNYIASHTKTLTLYAPVSVVPTVSGFTSSETTPGIAANVGAFVQNASKPRIQASSAGIYGSTIVATSVKVGAQTMAGADVTTPNAVPTSGAVPVVITVTDSRGRTGTLSASITVLPWQPPQVAGVAVSRRGTAAGTGAQTDSGTFVRIDLTTVVQSLVVGGTERNAATYTLAYRAVGSTGGFTVDRTGTRVIGSSAAFIMASLEVPADASREYLLTVTDDVGPTMVIFSIASSILVHLDGSAGVGVRKRRQRGALDVLGDVYTSAKLYLGGALTDFVDGVATAADVVSGTAGRIVTSAVLKPILDLLPVRVSVGVYAHAANVSNGTGVTLGVTFPAGRFTVAPFVFALPNTSRLTLSSNNILTTGCNIRADNWTPGAAAGSQATPILVYWLAIQMTASSAAG